MSDLKVAVVGLGSLGRHHLAPYLKAEEVTRIAVCDTSAEALGRAKADSTKPIVTYTRLEEMLERERPDVVSVTTPDHMHRAHAVTCLEAGCHVLLTKPLATNLEDGRAIVRAAESSAGKLMLAHERRFRPFFTAIKEMLVSGALGDIIHIRCDSVQDKRRQFTDRPWYASSEAGRTAIVGSGIHQVDVMRYLVGREILSVSAYANALGTLPFPSYKTTNAIYRFQGDGVGSVTVTYEAHWPKAGAIDDNFRLVATQGIIVGNKAAVDGRDDWIELPPDDDPIPQASAALVRSFLTSVLEDKPVAVSAGEAFSSLAAAVAADESAASGKPTVPQKY